MWIMTVDIPAEVYEKWQKFNKKKGKPSAGPFSVIRKENSKIFIKAITEKMDK